MDEAELPLEEYSSFGCFFARRLRDGTRPVDAGDDVIISPCDGALGAGGFAEGGELVQAKGHHYSLDELVVDRDLAAHLQGGSYQTYYLSPRDYHRVHAPLRGKLVGYVHVPGALFPVSQAFVRQVDRLFVKNERLVLHLVTDIGHVALVMIAAAGVGNLALSKPQLEFSSFRRTGQEQPRFVEFEEPIELERGEELGAFLLGSTVVVIFEQGRVEPLSQESESLVAFGEPVARRLD